MNPRTIVITNDDGIEAEGLRALEAAAAERFPEARRLVVAPDRCHSQCGHAFVTDRPLTLNRMAEDRYSCDGTPVDCVRLALFGLGIQPDLVLSGINHGGNLGHDLAASGTVAAAREAAWHGITAVALSHYRNRGHEIDWSLAATRSAAALGQLLDPNATAEGPLLLEGDHVSVNLPHPAPGNEAREPDLVECHPERAPLPVAFNPAAAAPDDPARMYHYTGSYGDRRHARGSDVQVCFGGDISWCRLRLPI